jgi:putative spermidine/putrescine transport system substrate-binding protein
MRTSLHVLLSVAAITIGSALAPQGALGQQPRYDGQVLRVATYGGSTGKAYRDFVTKPFEQRTGARIEWSEGSPQDFIAQLIVAKGSVPPYDVVIIEDLQEPQAISNKLIVKPDYARMPNAKLLERDAIPASGYGPARNFVRIGLAVLPGKLKEAGIPLPKDLSIIFDPRLAGHIAIPDATQANWLGSMPGIAAFLKLPITDPKPTLDRLAGIKGLSLYSSSSDVEARMTSGEIWVSLWTDGRANALKLKGVDIEFVPMAIPNPKGGTYEFIAVKAVPQLTNAAKKELGEIFIDTMISTPVATSLTLATTYTPTNVEARKALQADPKIGRLMNTDLSRQFQPDWQAWQQVEAKWLDAWGRTMRRR